MTTNWGAVTNNQLKQPVPVQNEYQRNSGYAAEDARLNNYRQLRQARVTPTTYSQWTAKPIASMSSYNPTTPAQTQPVTQPRQIPVAQSVQQPTSIKPNVMTQVAPSYEALRPTITQPPVTTQPPQTRTPAESFRLQLDTEKQQFARDQEQWLAEYERRRQLATSMEELQQLDALKRDRILVVQAWAEQQQAREQQFQQMMQQQLMTSPIAGTLGPI